jgi:hypothetical protein
MGKVSAAGSDGLTGAGRATMPAVNELAGPVILLSCGVAILVTAGPLRTRLPRPVVDVLLALEGAALAAGGLLLLDDVGTWSWVVGPAALAVLTPLHVRALFAGEGPFRT